MQNSVCLFFEGAGSSKSGRRRTLSKKAVVPQTVEELGVKTLANKSNFGTEIRYPDSRSKSVSAIVGDLIRHGLVWGKRPAGGKTRP